MINVSISNNYQGLKAYKNSIFYISEHFLETCFYCPSSDKERHLRVQVIDVHREVKKTDVTSLVIKLFVSFLGALRTRAIIAFSLTEFGCFKKDYLKQLKNQATMEVTTEVTTEVKKLIKICKGEQTRSQLQQFLGLKENEYFRKAYIKPAIEQGLLEMTIPDKPNSRNQKYRLTDKGLGFRNTLDSKNGGIVL